MYRKEYIDDEGKECADEGSQVERVIQPVMIRKPWTSKSML